MSCNCPASHFDVLITGDSSLAEAWATLPRMALAPGQRLFTAGEVVSSVWRVQEGLLRLFYLSPEGDERNRSFHVQGHWLGAGVPEAPTISAYSAEALEPSVLVRLPYAQLKIWQTRHQGVRDVLLDILTRVFAETARRESSLLLMDAAARYEAFLKDSPELAERVALHHVAGYLGITNVALSRIRKRLGFSAHRHER